MRRGFLREHLVERRAQLAEARLELGAVARQHVEEAAQLRRRCRAGVSYMSTSSFTSASFRPRRLPRSVSVSRARSRARVDAVAAGALRREQAAVLVEADRPRRQAELARELADRERRRRRRGRPVRRRGARSGGAGHGD